MRQAFVQLSLCLTLCGCALQSTAPTSSSPGAALQGVVHGGQQPVVAAHVYLFAAGTAGYGGASTSLLNATLTGHSDSLGAYVLSDAAGSFSITTDYTCTPNSQVYLYAQGGNPGAGVNSAAGFLAVLGNCPSTMTFATTTPYLFVNEVSTVAAAYALAGFATDATHVSSSGTALAQTGIANAFLNATNIETLSTGVALAATTNGNGTVPQTRINSLANILAACVNSTGSLATGTSCNTLFNNAAAAGSSGTLPTDTASAAINIAHHPANAVATLFGLQAGVGAPFAPALTAAPNDLTISLTFNLPNAGDVQSAAVDASGNVFFSSYYQGNSNLYGNVTKLSSLGALLSGSNGILNTIHPSSVILDQFGSLWAGSGSGIYKADPNTGAISFCDGCGQDNAAYGAFDASGNIFVPTGNSTAYTQVAVFSNSGTRLSGADPGNYGANGPYSSAGGFAGTNAFAFDGNGHLWASTSGNHVAEMSSGGGAISPSTGYLGLGAINDTANIAIDSSNNVWFVNYRTNSVIELNNAGTQLSPTSGYTASSIVTPFTMVLDGAGNVWVGGNPSSSTGGNITEFSNAGTLLSGTTGYRVGTGQGSDAIAIDGSGNVWSGANQYLAFEIIGAAVPVITPLSAAVTANAIASRP